MNQTDLFQDYARSCEEQTKELIKLIEWWKENGYGRFAALLRERTSFMSLPETFDYESLYQWVWWHPESADHHVARLSFLAMIWKKDNEAREVSQTR